MIQHLRDTTAMLNYAIRELRTIDPDAYRHEIELWSEQAKANMALIAQVEASPKSDRDRVSEI